MDKIIHPSSDVLSENIGDDTLIWQYSVILPGAVIGSNCNINCHCFIENDVVIGNNVTVKSGVQIWNGLRIANNVFIGPNVTFTNDRFPRSKMFIEKHEKTLINEGASIGANSTILVGVTLGEYSLVGAGSVVTKSILPYTVWYGNPARHRGYITRDAIILDLKLFDKVNKIQYVLDGNKPIIK